METLRRVTDLFLHDADRLNDEQIAVFDDVLMHLMRTIEAKALAQLSQTLAPVGNAPIETVRRLAHDDDIAVSGPVLRQSERLTDSDLVALAKVKSQEHLLAISDRATLAPVVTDVLIVRGDSLVCHQLAKNAGAAFSDFGFSSLVRKAQNDDLLAERLGTRLDLPLNLLKELLRRATDALRTTLLAIAAPEHRGRIQNVLDEIATQVGFEASGARDYTRSESRVRELNRLGRLNEAVLQEFAQDRKYEEMASCLALFCQVKVQLIESLLKNVGYDGLLVACRATNLSWATVSAILAARFAHHSISEQELKQAHDSYYALSPSSAQRTLRFMTLKTTLKVD